MKPAQGVSPISPCATSALPETSPWEFPRLNTEMLSAEAKSTAFGVNRSAVASLPLCTAGEMPNASPSHTNNTRMVGIWICIT